MRLARRLFLTAACFTALVPAHVFWNLDYKRGLEEARKTNRPVLVVFWAAWCGPCWSMDRDVWDDPGVLPLLHKFVCLKINIDKDHRSASRYHVEAVPRILILDPSANVLSDRTGFQNRFDVIRLLSAIPSDFTPIAKLNAQLQENSDNFPACLSIAEFYGQLGVLDLSSKYLKASLKTTQGKSHSPCREQVLVMLGANSMKLNNAEQARKLFEQSLSEFKSDGTRCHLAMLGLVTTLAGQGKLNDAEAVLTQLQAQFPGSEAAEQAARNIEDIRARR
ncbi:MAG: DUF255 domain-containing protein [Acidobacteria bacterium]|nr:MAG: DUF255 domain-containing protein [Acidobacteriota bacterium]